MTVKELIMRVLDGIEAGTVTLDMDVLVYADMAEEHGIASSLAVEDKDIESTQLYDNGDHPFRDSSLTDKVLTIVG